MDAESRNVFRGVIEENKRLIIDIARIEDRSDKLTHSLADCKKRLKKALTGDDDRILERDQIIMSLRNEISILNDKIRNINADIETRADILAVEKMDEYVGDIIKNIQCCICLNQRRSVLLLPCKHVNVCKKCAVDISTCSVCRSEIKERINIFI